MNGDTQGEAADAAVLNLDLQCDQMLQHLVMAANVGTGFPVTLLTGGMMVTGSVVSGRRFVQHMLDDVVSTVGNEGVREDLKGAFSTYLDAYPEGQAQVEGRLTIFIHLENAKFFVPGGAQPIPTGGKGVFWRGKIADVSGFNFGTLAVTK